MTSTRRHLASAVAERVPNVASIATSWWKTFLVEIDPSRAVAVTSKAGETRVLVEDRIPHLRRRGFGQPRYRVTTEPQFLSPTAFPRKELRRAISHDAAKERRRALFCVDDATGDVLAACSFHIDEKPSVRLTLCDLALREDSPTANAWSVFAAHILIGYLLEIAARADRTDSETVEFLARNSAEEERAAAVGFKLCAGTGTIRGASRAMCFKRPR
jgi:hypothetical protein